MNSRIAALRAARELEPDDAEPDDAAARVRRALWKERAELRYRLTKKGQAEMRARIAEMLGRER
jgi:hypothetical protein